MQKEIITELEDVRDETEFIINNEEFVENKHIENYLRSLERIRYNIFNKIKLNNKYEVNEQDKLMYLNDRYEVSVNDNYLKIYIPEVIPKYKNINNYAYKNIMLNVMEKTKPYRDLFRNELVSNWKRANYMTEDKTYIIIMPFIDTEKLHGLNVFYRNNQNTNRKIDIITLKENEEKINEILTNKVNIIEIDNWLGGISGEESKS